MILRIVLGFFVLTLLASCQSGLSDKQLGIYYDLETVLEKQAEQFYRLNPRVEKTVNLDGKVETSVISFDSAGWAKELEIFLENRINKPSFVGAFREEMIEEGVVYHRIDSRADGVQTFKVSFLDSTEEPKEISVINISSNALYNSERELKLQFERTDEYLRLSAYSIRGTQTILSQAPTEYSVKGRLLY